MTIAIMVTKIVLIKKEGLDEKSMFASAATLLVATLFGVMMISLMID